MGIHCLLISTNQVETPYPVYPLGIAHLAASLQADGHEVSIFDVLGGDLRHLEDLLCSVRFDLIGLSIRNLDTVDSSLPVSFVHQAAELMSLVRQHSTSPVVVGGPAFSLLPEQIFAVLNPNYGIVGEGEKLLSELAEGIQTGSPPQSGIMGRKPCSESWRPAAYQREVAAYYLQNGGMLNVQTKRGCPYQCSYCSYPTLEGRRIRGRDPLEVAEDVQRLTKEFGAKYIFFADAVFNDPQGHFLEVAEALIQSRNKTPWCAFFRPQGMTAKDIGLLKEAGLAAMEFGTDASTDRTLKALNKGFLFSDVVGAHNAALAAGVPAAHFVIFGGPQEDSTTLKEGLNNIAGLKHSVVFGCTGIRLLPDARICQQAIASGVIGKDHDFLEPTFYFSETIEPEELETTIKKAWQERLDRIFPIHEMIPRIRRLHQKGYIGPGWDLLITKH